MKKNIEVVYTPKNNSETEQIKLTLPDFYQQYSPQFYQQYRTDCRQIGYALFCSPCPHHPTEKHDAMVFDILSRTRGMYFTCVKEMAYTDEYVTFNNAELTAIEEMKKTVKPKDVETTRSEIVERQYLMNNIIISFHNGSGEGYRSYRYISNEGIYTELSPGTIKAELQLLYENLWGMKPSLNLLTEMKNKIQVQTVIEGDETIFSPRKGDIHYIVGRVKDIEVNRRTGEVRVLDKDPLGRPFLKRFPYDFSAETPEDMPKELEFMRRYTTPKFFDNILIMLASGLAFKSDAQIFVLISRDHGTGKSTFANILEKLFGRDLVAKVQPKHFYDQYVEAKLEGKSLMIMEEYRGGAETIDESLKRLASEDSTIPINRKHKEHIDIDNTVTIITSANGLSFHTDDQAFLRRLMITPFTHNWSRDEYPTWLNDQSTKERIIMWLIKNVLPRYLKQELKPVTYPIETVTEWLSERKTPEDGIEDYLNDMYYPHCNPHNSESILVTLDKVFQYYLFWADRHNMLPASDAEFKVRLDRLKTDDMIVEKEGEECMCLKKAEKEDKGN